METVIIPAANAPELSEIPPHVTDKIVVKPVRTMDEVLEIALVRSLATMRKQEPAIEPDIGGGKPARGTRASRKPTTRPGMA
jgi:ATP-dependent Lon protease